MNPINDEGTPEAYLRGKAMEHKLNLVSSMLSNLRLATGLNKEVFAYYQRGLQALEEAEALYDDNFREALSTDYFNMFFMRGNLLVARGALAQTETERDAYFEDATYAYRRAEKVKPNNKGSDLPNSRANLCLYKSDNKTGYADAALFLNQANGFISEAIQDAKQHNLTALPYFLYVTMGRYYLADARVHPHTSDAAIANAEGCFAAARDGCRTSPRRTKAINHVIAQLQAIYADLPPVIKTGDPYAPLRQKPDGAENATCG